jgi:hypothetical protein
MSGEHKMVIGVWSPAIKVQCSCGHWFGEFAYNGIASARREHADHIAAAAAETERQRVATHIEWYQRTGHCGQCGEPGVFCVCRTPCGCHELHECGSGLLRDPAEVFAETGSPDQDGLF